MTPAHATLVPDIPSLDGLRALSVLIVMVSHAGLGHVVPGGLGVTVFLVVGLCVWVWTMLMGCA